MSLNIKEDDIEYVMKINPDRNNANAPNTSRIKITLKDYETKNKIYINKWHLKGKDVWISEDLTPYKAKLFYQARKAVKDGHANLTWTMDGKIFIKKRKESPPKRIDNIENILSHLELDFI